MSEEPSDKPTCSKKNNGLNGYQEFHDLIANKTDVRVALFSHRCPDPDAIASMMGMQLLLRRAFGIESDLFYAGEVSHPQNGVMNNLLDPGMKRIDDEYDAKKYGLHILVDTIPDNAGIGKQQITFDVVIDHHREVPQHFTGVLIHRKCGAASSIIFDMMKHFIDKEDWLDEDVDADTKVATALIAGIVTDTEYMMSDDSTELEFRAFSELFEYRNSGFLKQIVFFKRPKFWIEKIAEGSSKAFVDNEGLAIVGLGVIPDKQRDLVSAMAEEMASWASVETAIAFAIVGGDKIVGSVRSLNVGLTVADFCKKLGGKYGNGGGKLGKGAYQLPLAASSIDPDEDEADIEEAWESIRKREIKRIKRVNGK